MSCREILYQAETDSRDHGDQSVLGDTEPSPAFLEFGTGTGTEQIRQDGVFVEHRI